jgi:hypothetical protein
VLFLVGQDMVLVLTSLFVGFLSMFLVEESFSCAQFSFGGGCLLPCSQTVNLAWTMFLVHSTWYSKLFLCGVDHLHTTKVFNSQFYSRNLSHPKKGKRIWNPAKGQDSKLTCSQLITRLVKM